MADKIDLYDMMHCLEGSPYQDHRAVIDSHAGILLPGCGGVEFCISEDKALLSRKHKGVFLNIKLSGPAPAYTVAELRDIVAGALEEFPDDRCAEVLCNTPGGVVGSLQGNLHLEERGEPGHFFLHGSVAQRNHYSGVDYVPA